MTAKDDHRQHWSWVTWLIIILIALGILGAVTTDHLLGQMSSGAP